MEKAKKQEKEFYELYEKFHKKLIKHGFTNINNEETMYKTSGTCIEDTPKFISEYTITFKKIH